MGLRERLARRWLRPEYETLTAKAQAFESAMRVAPWRMTGQDLLREMDQQTLDLLRRQLQYQVVIGGEAGELDRLAVVEMARHYYNNADPLIWRMVSIWTDYGFGQHIQLTMADERAQEVVDAFVDAPSNKGILSDREMHKLSDILLIDGEIFLLFFVSTADGTVTIRRIPTEQITAIECDPDDEDVQILYRREWTPKSGEKQTLYYRDWTASEENVRQVLGALTDAKLAEQRNEATPQYVMHIPYNTLEKRGWPMVGRSIPWAEEYRRFLEARAAVAASVAQFVREAKAVGGGSRAVDAIKSFFASSQQTSSTDWERNPAAAPGSTLATNSAVDMKQYPLTTGAGDAQIDGMTLASQAGVGMGIPPHLLGRPDAMQNRATAKETLGPLMRQLERYQVFWSSVFRDIVDFVLTQAEEHGGQRFEDHGCTVTMDSPFDADLGQVMNGLGILGQLGAVTPKVAAEIALAMPDYNVQDLQGTIDEMFPEKEPPAPEPTNVAGVPGTAAPEQSQVEEPETTDGVTTAEAIAMLEAAQRVLAGEEFGEGGPGSGNWGHAGIKGQRGGSMPKSGMGAAMSLSTGATAAQRQEEAKSLGYRMKGRRETEMESELRSEIGQAQEAVQAARLAGNEDEARAIEDYAESVKQTLEEERSANQALWDTQRVTPEKATDADWEQAAKRLDRQAQDAYKKYTQDGIQLAVDIKRSARDSGYMNVGGESVMVKRGKFSRAEASRMRGSIWSQAKEEVHGRMGKLLQKAGYKPAEIARASFEQRQKLLQEIGQGDLAKTGRGKVANIDQVAVDARGRVRSKVPPTLAAKCAAAGDSPLNLPGIDAYAKMELADRIRTTKVGGYGE